VNAPLTRLLVVAILALVELVMVATAIIPIALPIAPVLPARQLARPVPMVAGGLAMGQKQGEQQRTFNLYQLPAISLFGSFR